MIDEQAVLDEIMGEAEHWKTVAHSLSGEARERILALLQGLLQAVEIINNHVE